MKETAAASADVADASVWRRRADSRLANAAAGKFAAEADRLDAAAKAVETTAAAVLRTDRGEEEKKMFYSAATGGVMTAVEVIIWFNTIYMHVIATQLFNTETSTFHIKNTQ
jgi:site-specific recombinase